MSERWGRARVLELAPDAASRRAAEGLAVPGSWTAPGCDERVVWGECHGSKVYRTRVEPGGPAYRCSCPSRKLPCKHALALLLLWAEGTVPGGEPPAWAEPATAAPSPGPRTAGPRTAERREGRVSAGLAELDRWLRDQVARGLAQAETAPYALWDEAARRLVDAQAPGAAGQVKALAAVPRQGAGWPGRLLEEYALLHLLVRAYSRQEELPAGLRETVRSRIGFPVAREEVLALPPVRDRWYVAGVRDSEQERLVTRRIWLRGRTTGRSALVLTFAAPGRTFEVSLPAGSTVDAPLHFFPGAQPLRALAGEPREEIPAAGPPPGLPVARFLAEHAAALARDPWLDQWPCLLSGVRLSADRHLVDGTGAALPLAGGDPWRLLAVSGGGPVTVGGEWTPSGLVALTAWHPAEGAIAL